LIGDGAAVTDEEKKQWLTRFLQARSFFLTG
jgi:hypothetical protein